MCGCYCLRDLTRGPGLTSPIFHATGGVWAMHGRVLSSEISAEAHPRGVLSRVVSSGFSCRVPHASPNPYLFPIAHLVKAQFLADFWTLVAFEPLKEVSIIPPKSGKSWAKNCNTGENSLDRKKPLSFGKKPLEKLRATP